MNKLEAVMTVENGECSKEEYVKAWQKLIDTGIVWELQGWFGRGAIRMIEDGYCHYK